MYILKYITQNIKITRRPILLPIRIVWIVFQITCIVMYPEDLYCYVPVLLCTQMTCIVMYLYYYVPR